jgi:hypothetical protein
LSSLTDNQKSRRVLDYIWDNGAVQACLEQGYWNFAMRTVRLDATTDIEPDFGYKYAFNKPSDWVRTYAVCTDEFFTSPLTQYEDEAEYWFCEYDEIYVQYVSNGDEYGNNLGSWPESFKNYVEHYLANKAAPRLTLSTTKKREIRNDTRVALRDARTQDSSNQAMKLTPLGTWSQSRLGWNGNRRRDRGL